MLKLENSQTLDNCIIVKCDEDTLHSRKYKGVACIYKHNYVKFPYATIKGSDKNVSKAMKHNRFKIQNITYSKQLPSQSNFSKKLVETLGQHILREKYFTAKHLTKYILEILILILKKMKKMTILKSLHLMFQ